MLLKLPVTLAGDAVKFLVGKVKSYVTGQQASDGGGGVPGGGGPTSADAKAAMAYARTRMNAFGWGGSGEWDALVSLWMGECLTIDAMILTRRGWLTYDEVRAGDETIGYNPEIGRSEWTLIERVVHYGDAEVWRIGGTRWHANATPGHRWWSDTRQNNGRGSVREESGFVRTSELSRYDRLRLAAPADTDGIPGLSTEDAAILAWIQGDGHIDRRDGRIDGARIYQSKPAQITRLRALLAHVEHKEAVYRADKGQPEHVFLFRSGYIRGLLKRSGLDETGPEQMVLAMSPDQRAAWLTSIIDAEGNAVGGYVMITQNDGPLSGAIQLAVYLEGHRPNKRVHQRVNGVLSWKIGLGNPHASVGRFQPHQVLERQPVWCVSTTLGSWTAQQDGQVFLTGNSGWSRVAQNRSSGAYGIPQALPGSKMGPAANPPTSSAGAQIDWGMNYIKGVYRDPINAMNKWLSRSPHGYDNGGWLQPGTTLVRNDTGRPELVISGDQLDALTKAGPGGRAGGQLAGTINIMLPEGGTVADAFSELTFRLRAAQHQSWTGGNPYG